jgi:hypothetical protein
MGGWEVKEASWDFVCSSEVLEAGFLDCSRLVCWYGWEGADGSIVGKGLAISLVLARRIWGSLVVGKLANTVSAGNGDRRSMIETSEAGYLSL